MARRKKEDPIVHQNRIANEAELLFSEKGIDHTSMDEVARSAGYSKATLYVYFKNKEEIVSFLVLRSMNKLKYALLEAVNASKDSKAQFKAICNALVNYQEEYPEYFDMTLKYIDIDTDDKENSFDYQTYQVGEEINACLSKYLEDGEKKKEICLKESRFVTIFHMWGMISGLIKIASEKKEYIEMAGKIKKSEFLESGFETIYRIIENSEK